MNSIVLQVRVAFKPTAIPLAQPGHYPMLGDVSRPCGGRWCAGISTTSLRAVHELGYRIQRSSEPGARFEFVKPRQDPVFE